MRVNMGMMDRGIRVGSVILVGLLYANNMIEGLTAYVLMGFAGIFVLTSIVGFCPLYLPFNLNTKGRE